MVRRHVGKLFGKKKIRIVAALDLIKCLKHRFNNTYMSAATSETIHFQRENIDITYCRNQSYGFSSEHPAAPIWTFGVSDPDPKKRRIWTLKKFIRILKKIADP